MVRLRGRERGERAKKKRRESPYLEPETAERRRLSYLRVCSSYRHEIYTLSLPLIPTARVAVFMRGLGTFLDYPISIAKAWRPLAVEVLKEKDLAGVHP